MQNFFADVLKSQNMTKGLNDKDILTPLPIDDYKNRAENDLDTELGTIKSNLEQSINQIKALTGPQLNFRQCNLR